MEYQKLINLLNNTANQDTFKTKYWVEINDETLGTYNANSQIELKTTMLKSSLRVYSDTYILVNGTITITGGPETRKSDERNKEVIFINSATFTEYISKEKKKERKNKKHPSR